MTSGPDPGELPGFWGSMVFRHAPMPRKGSGKQQQQQHGVCYYYLNCFICFGALFMAQNVCYYYLNCFICFGALFMAHPVYNRFLT